MTTQELARAFRARREGKNYRAKCPVHRSRGLSLGLYPKENSTKIVCYAGCDPKDILASVGLRVRDIFYHSRDCSSEALKAHLKKQRIDSLYRRERRIMDLRMVLAAVNLKPYQRAKRTKDSFTRDIEAAYRAY